MNPARLPGLQYARYQESWPTKIIYAGGSQLTALFAQSGLIPDTLGVCTGMFCIGRRDRRSD